MHVSHGLVRTRLGAGVQARLEADPSILSRLGRDCCLDLLAILGVSLARQNRLGRDADLVASQVRGALMCRPGVVHMLSRVRNLRS